MLLSFSSGRPVVVPWDSFPVLEKLSVFCTGLYKRSSTGLEKCRCVRSVYFIISCFACSWTGIKEMLQNPPVFQLLLLPISTCSFIPIAALYLFSTFCLSDQKFLFLAPIHRDGFILSIASLYLVHILLLLSMFLPYLWISPPQIFVSLSFLALSWHSCHLTFLMES